MRLVFVGQKDDHTETSECIEMGIAFPRGVAVPVSDAVFEALSKNPSFNAVPDEKPARKYKGIKQ